MTPERRKYLKSMDMQESVARLELENIKELIWQNKRNLEKVINLQDEVLKLNQRCLIEILKAKARLYKKMYMYLKQQLPQHLPKENIKSCPFCKPGVSFVMEGGKNLDKHYVVCVDCGNRTMLHDTEEEAIKAWNRRRK